MLKCMRIPTRDRCKIIDRKRRVLVLTICIKGSEGLDEQDTLCSTLGLQIDGVSDTSMENSMAASAKGRSQTSETNHLNTTPQPNELGRHGLDLA